MHQAAAALMLAGMLMGMLAGGAAASSLRVAAVAVAGADLRITLSDGRVLPGRALAGAVLDLGAAGLLRVVATFADPADPTGETWLFDVRDAATGAPFCLPDPQGQRLALPLADGDGGVRFTCTSGAEAKCVRLGYAPWRPMDDGRSLAPFHAACVRMVRADYGGDGTAWTHDGTTIDLFDSIGLQHTEAGTALAFEAGWSADGAVCVAHPRVAVIVTLEELAARYPQLAAAAGPEACTEERAAARGALLFNRSARR
jgi:hypothetical protein